MLTFLFVFIVFVVLVVLVVLVLLVMFHVLEAGCSFVDLLLYCVNFSLLLLYYFTEVDCL